MKYATALALLASSAAAHLFLVTPTPITGNAIKDPLIADGSNFPCHGVTPPGSGGAAMAVGSQQTLRFDTGNGANTAVHGGGSCQLSLTYETDATAIKDPSNWKVIYSIEGGCPTNSPLNLDGEFVSPTGTDYTGAYQCDDPSTNGYDCANVFNFTIPQGVKNGQATFAWTWFNNVGNREMYMNCVAVDITGGSDDASAMSSFPSMFVANLAGINGGTCKTTESQNVAFPNPGPYVTQRKASSKIPVSTAKDYPLSTPTGCGAVAAAATNAGAASSSAAGAASATAAATTAVATTAPVAATTMATSAAPSVASTPKKGGKTTKTKSTKKASNTGTVGNAGTAASGAAPAAATAGSCASGSVACSGGVNSVMCIDSTHFGICDYNGCAVSQAVASGTMCLKGAITWATPNRKRHMAVHRHAKIRA